MAALLNPVVGLGSDVALLIITIHEWLVSKVLFQCKTYFPLIVGIILTSGMLLAFSCHFRSKEKSLILRLTIFRYFRLLERMLYHFLSYLFASFYYKTLQQISIYYIANPVKFERNFFVTPSNDPLLDRSVRSIFNTFWQFVNLLHEDLV